MAKRLVERIERGGKVPSAPAPLAASARDGAEIAREEVRRYLPNLVRLLLGIALGDNYETSMHTRVLSARQLVEIGGMVQPAIPMAPSPQSYEHMVDGRDAD